MEFLTVHCLYDPHTSSLLSLNILLSNYSRTLPQNEEPSFTLSWVINFTFLSHICINDFQIYYLNIKFPLL
jgi:hypothetical protein